MRLHVEYTGQLQAALGRAAEDVHLPPGATIAALLENLEQREQLRAGSHIRAATGVWQAGLLVGLNGTALAARQAASIALNDGDVVTLLPPIGGG